MEHGKLNFVQKDDSIFAGAIFMSNRETKLECLQRKLFGLPLSKSKFLKQVKAGMILFLFEHVERKLYGVFEATSDGALNIIPDAFRSTGQSYPAQILFKRIWMCKPLCEDEFRSAIEENYYSPYKFNFGLSYKQVIKLIHLFYTRKINIKQYKGHGTPNKIIEQFEKTAADEVRLFETETFFKCKSEDNSGEGKREVRRPLALPQTSLDPAMLYKISDTTTSMQHTITNTGIGPKQVSPLSHPHDLCSETFESQRCSINLSHDHTAFHHFSMGYQPSTTSELEYNRLPPHMPNLDNSVAPYLMDVKHLSTLPCERTYNDPNTIQRMNMIQEEDAFTSLHAMNDVSPRIEIVPHACLSAAQPAQLIKFPYCLPLAEESQQRLSNRENQNSSLANSEYIPSTIRNSCIPSTCKEISSNIYSADEYSYDDELTYQRVEADEYNAGSGRLHADSDLSRTSVFSRLSRSQRIPDHETSKPSSADSSEGLSLDCFLNILSERKNYWSVVKVSKQSMECDSYEQYGSTVSTEHFDHSNEHQSKIKQLPVEPAERSEIDQYDGISETEHVGFTPAYDVVAEESFELPFYNFRRRNTSQKHEVQDDSNKHGDICSSEAKLMKIKRRRIVRPSLFEEMHQDAKAETEVKKSAQMKEQTEVEVSAQAISESKNECKAIVVNSFLDRVVPVLQTVRKYKLVGESLEQNHVISIDGSLDYIPIG